MARPVTIEDKKLVRANKLIDAFIRDKGRTESSKLAVLEAVSCRYSGIPLATYRAATAYDDYITVDDAYIDELVAEIDACGMPVAVALASLARIDEGEVSTKRNGSVYTDFRLAKYLAHNVMSGYTSGPIIDPSCGTSIILAACAEERCANDNVDTFVSENLYGIDLSPYAIRGSLLVLATYLRDSLKLESLISHFVCGNSLEIADGIPTIFGLKAFSAVVGNPPWERVRPSRNEFAREYGLRVDYGAELHNLPSGYEKHRDASRTLSNKLSKAYGLKGGADLYRAFLDLSIKICEQGGCVAMYLPAGVIRSKSLAPARSLIVEEFRKVRISVFMNHAKFFAIDSRFKFILAMLREKHHGSNGRGVHFQYCTANNEEVFTTSELTLDEYLFNDSSRELGAPEVKSDAEAAILKRIWLHAERMTNHALFGNVHPVRELDMTLNRHLFKTKTQINNRDTLIPLIEGRMVSQFRCGCKEYLSGSGRSAKWKVVPIGGNHINPQFYVSEADLTSTLLNRIEHRRIGFCDIAGQTNERAMQATFIPRGCVCGNKVPTLLFEDDDSAMLWLGIVNSFVFDWIVRRYITTTINFFILDNLPFPAIDSKGSVACAIINCVTRIMEMQNGDDWGQDEMCIYALERAQLEALVIEAYKLDTDTMDVILADFPLVDQINAKTYGGAKPTIELVRAVLAHDNSALEKAKDALARGAMPYIPNEHMRSMLKNGK